ncbi:MAG: hypothetical protein HQL19_01515 [Candidatus Omnitrophica bacterium]|nr:hypothetical protein [Candidatus Omnitrophota bacterium]
MKTSGQELRNLGIIILILGFAGGTASVAHASMKEMKMYKEAFPGVKVKCVDCHVAQSPKKDDGQHEVNEYSKAVAVAAGDVGVSAEAYKKVGTVEDFAAKNKK